jgi:transcription elongation factor GreA
MKETLITEAGLARLCHELDRLKTTGRQDVVERISHARSTDADPTANADHLAARDEQARLEARIARLERRLAAARLVTPDATNETVDLGERVRVRELDSGSNSEYELVGSFEEFCWPFASMFASASGPARPVNDPNSITSAIE